MGKLYGPQRQFFSWTPVFSFTTPGNLAITYSGQVGEGYIDGNMCELFWRITTSAFTHTSASGNLEISGHGKTSKTVTNMSWEGSMWLQGITKANYTNFVSKIGSATDKILIGASGSAQAVANIVFGDVPTGGSVILIGSLRFPMG